MPSGSQTTLSKYPSPVAGDPIPVPPQPFGQAAHRFAAADAERDVTKAGMLAFVRIPDIRPPHQFQRDDAVETDEKRLESLGRITVYGAALPVEITHVKIPQFFQTVRPKRYMSNSYSH